mmetsp:Transcript_5271/g.8124  ORF Transcript_5271/g.8124 Transcript_5271/m.8124 type:complete len:87 (+) Transcript_5271:1815-2075(+)
MRALQKVAFLFWKRKLRREFQTHLGLKVRSLHKCFPIRLCQPKHSHQEGMSDSLESGMMRRLFNSELNLVKNYFGKDQWFYAWDVE